MTAPVTFGALNRLATHDMHSAPGRPNSRGTEGIEVTEEYDAVSRQLQSGVPIVLVSGKAGTGKSTLINHLRDTLKGNTVVLAPTGVAAINVKGATIHSFFHFPPRIINDDDISQARDRRLYANIDLLVVDEISMVRADLLDAMDKFLRLNGRRNDQSFGGTQLLLVGDLFQLPPVVSRAEEGILLSRKYTSPYFFSARSLHECEFEHVELRKGFRQQDPEFVELLDKIRVAEQLEDALPVINARYPGPGADHAQIITLTCTNAAADKINRTELDRLSGQPGIFVGETSGTFSIEEERLPAPHSLRLKPGAQVMFVKNAEGVAGRRRWVNGTLGRVVGWKEQSIQVELLTEQPGTVQDVHRAVWEAYRYEYDYAAEKVVPTVTGRYTQFPLMLAWAVTIHKSQGKTLEKVRVDLGTGAFSPGQVYVALSRCRSLADTLLARPIREQEIKCDPRIKRFYLALTDLRNGPPPPGSR